MLPKSIGVILDIFLEKYPSDDIENDPEIGELFQSLKRKFEYYGRDFTEIQQGRTLKLLQKYLPEML